MSDPSQAELLAAMQELTAVIRGLTAVLIEDQGEPDEEAQEAAVVTYMDGSPIA